MAQSIYQSIVLQARHPNVYRSFDIPDTVQGRFESLAIHLFIVLRALKSHETAIAQSVSQHLCNAFVADVDHSLRELSISEGKVNKQIKRLVEGFYGRLLAYDAAVIDFSHEGLLQSILKNIYDHNESCHQAACKLVEYMKLQIQAIQQQSLDKLSFVSVEGF